MKYIQIISLFFLFALLNNNVANAALIFSTDVEIGNIRQGSGNYVQINIDSNALYTNCSKQWAIALVDDHPAFDRIYSAVLMSKASDRLVQFAVHDNQCTPDGFAVIDAFIVKD